MSTLDVVFNFPPITVNHGVKTNYKSGRKYRTSELRCFRDSVAITLNQNIQNVRPFLRDFDKEVHAIKVLYTWYLEADKLLIKKRNNAGVRRISSNSGDAANIEKHLTDAIFDVFGWDDAFIYDIHLMKAPSLGPECIHAHFQIVPLKDIKEYQDFI